MIAVQKKKFIRRDLLDSPACEAIYYFYGKHAMLPAPKGRSGKTVSGYRYRCYKDGQEKPLFYSHNFRKGHAGSIFFSAEDDPPDLILKLRKSFPISGKIDLVDPRDNGCKGVVTRGHKLYDRSENYIARFRDRRRWKEHIGESVIDAVGNMILGGDSTAAPGGGASDLVLLADKKAVGTLSREALPFFPDPPSRTEPGKAGKLLKKVLPKNIGRALIDITPPLGWKLAIYDASPFTEETLLLCGALMTIEIERW